VRLNGYQCDDCGNIHNESSSMPEGWINVERKLKENWKKFFHFCSIGCLSAWALKQKMDESES